MPSNDAIYLYSLISHEMSSYLQENMKDVHCLPLENKKNLNNYVKALCSISKTFHEDTEISVEVLDESNIVLVFENTFYNILKRAKIVLSDIDKPCLELSLHRNSPVYKSDPPLICSRKYQTQFTEENMKLFSVIFENFRRARTTKIELDLLRYKSPILSHATGTVYCV